MTHREIWLIKKRYINTLKKILEGRGYYGGIKKLFDYTTNVPIKENYLIIRAKYLDELKDLCMKEA